MKTMIFVSLASIMPTAPLEHAALSRALAGFGHGFAWSLSDHLAMSQRVTMPEAIAAISPEIGEDHLLESYLVHFHTLLDAYSAPPEAEVLTMLGRARTEGQRCLLLSEYPLDTTNLARSAGLQTRATGVGTVFALPEAGQPTPLDARLQSVIEVEHLAPADCTAMVARLQDAKMAADLGLALHWVGADGISQGARRITPPENTRNSAQIPTELAGMHRPCRQPITAQPVAA